MKNYYLVIMKLVQSLLCFGICLPKDDIRPAGVVIMSRRDLYVASRVLYVKTQSERNQNGLHG